MSSKRYLFTYSILDNIVLITFPEFIKDELVLSSIKRTYKEILGKKVKFVNNKTFEKIAKGRKDGFIEITDDKIIVNFLNNSIKEYDRYILDKSYSLLLENKDKGKGEEKDASS